MLDEKENEAVSQYLRHGVINLLCEMMSSFNQTDNERLYDIATGRAVSLYTEEVLLTVNVSKCINDQNDSRKELQNRKCKHLKLNWEEKKFRDLNGKLFAGCNSKIDF